MAGKKTTKPSTPKKTGKSKSKKPRSSEAKSLVSSDAILDFLKGKAVGLAEMAGGKIAGWLTSQILGELGLDDEDPSQLDEMQDTLEEIKNTQEEILKGLDGVLQEVKFRALLTQQFDYTQRILSRYNDLVALTTTPAAEREKAVKRFIKATLDGNQGAIIDLLAIHNTLCEDQTGEKEPLITVFMKRWFEAAQKKELDPDFPVATYNERANEWLHSVFLLQYMGICQATNALLSTREYKRLQDLLSATVERLEQQKKLFDSYIPTWTTQVPNLFDGHSYIIPNDKSEVLYGEPGRAASGESTIWFRKRNKYNADEEWIFVPTGETDTFRLRTRTGTSYMGSVYYGTGLQYEDKKLYKLRLVMQKSSDKALLKQVETGKKPFSDLISPVLGILDLPEKDKAKSYLGIVKGNRSLTTVEKKDALEITLEDNNYYADSHLGAEIGKLSALKLEGGPLYFFQGFRYIEYDTEAQTATKPELISSLFPGMPFQYINAAVPLSAEKVYFFQGKQCVRWNLKSKKVEPGFPRDIREEFPHLLFDHVDTVIDMTGGAYIFVEREELIFYSLFPRMANDSARPFKPLYPAIPFDRIESSFNLGDQTYIIRRREAVHFNVSTMDRVKPQKAKDLTSFFPALQFPTFTNADGKLLLESGKFPARAATTPAAAYHDGKASNLPNADLNVGLSAENRTFWRFLATSNKDDSGTSRRDPIERMVRTGIFFQADSKWPGTTGPDGWVIYTAENDPRVSFRINWNVNYLNVADDYFWIDQVKGCKVTPLRFASSPMRKVNGKHLRITISV